jgi:probable F420-dependent oxidoreductase
MVEMGAPVRLGISTFPTESSMDPAALGRAMEERGFESLFVSEHTHIPVGRNVTPGGREMPEEFARTFDPFATLAAVAAVTERLLLGTAVCLVTERDPIHTAKEVSTVDRLSGGRFLFGIGGGWNRGEMANHGTEFSTRWRLLRERVLAMKEIWTKEAAEFHGEFVDFDPIWQWPKPVQAPHPPLIMGGSAERSIARAVDYCDGWMPIADRGDVPLADLVGKLQAAAGEAGRDRIPVTLYGAPPKPERLAAYAGAGVDRCLLALPPGGADDTLRRLDRYSELIPALA